MTDKELIEKMKEHIKQLEEDFARITAPPHTLATVCKLFEDGDNKYVLVTSSNGPTIVNAPTDKKLLKKLKVGSCVSIISITGGMSINDVFTYALPGVEANVKRLSDEQGMLEIESGMGSVIVYMSEQIECIRPGDIVLLDRTGQVALRTIKKDTTAHSVETATGVTWKDIGGQEDAKRILKEVLEEPIKYADLHKAYGKRPIKGILMHGAPGCGKTLLAKASANAIRETHGKEESETAFIYVKGPEVLNMWVGNTEAQIRGLFSRAREHKEKYGYPALIFIDEADAILGKRGSHHGSILSSTVVPTFLAEMDGLNDSGAFVMLATNRPDTLDPAIVRDGRIDRKVAVNRPGMMDSASILAIHLARTSLNTDGPQLAVDAARAIHSDDYPLYNVGISGKGVSKFHFRDLLSGAMLAGIVDQAVSIAIRRDINKGHKKASGIVWEDMEAAIIETVNMNKGLNHDDDLTLFIETRGGNIQQSVVQRV